MKVSEADDTAKLLHHATQEAKKQQAKKAEVEEFLGKVTLQATLIQEGMTAAQRDLKKVNSEIKNLVNMADDLRKIPTPTTS